MRSYEKKVLNMAIDYAMTHSDTVYYSLEIDMMNKIKSFGFKRVSKREKELLRLVLMDSMVNGFDSFASYEKSTMKKLYHRYKNKTQTIV